MDEITALRMEIASLRADAQKADENIAFMLGLLMEGSQTKLSFDPEMFAKAVQHPGWTDAILERVSAARELVRQALRDG